MTKARPPLRALSELRLALDARLERHPNYPDLRNLRGLARTYAGDHEGAFADFVEALRIHPHYEAALLNVAWLHVQRREAEQVRAILREPRGRRLAATARAHLLVLAAHAAGGAEPALQVLETQAPMHAEPRDTWLELDRLWLEWQLGRWDAVDRQVRRLVAWIPAVGPLFRHTGLVGTPGERRGAFALWGDCYRGNPHVAALLRECARLRAANAGSAECQHILRWSAVLSLDLCDYWLSVGEQHDLEARDVDAETAFRQASRVDARRAQPYINLGQLFAACGRPQEAIRELQHAAALQPRYADVRYLLGLLLEDLGQIEEAEGHLRTALDVNPNYTMARLALGYLLAARGRERDAVKHLEHVRRDGVVSADLETRLATLYEHLGRAEDAERARARAADPEAAAAAAEAAASATDCPDATP